MVVVIAPQNLEFWLILSWVHCSALQLVTVARQQIWLLRRNGPQTVQISQEECKAPTVSAVPALGGSVARLVSKSQVCVSLQVTHACGAGQYLMVRQGKTPTFFVFLKFGQWTVICTVCIVASTMIILSYLH